MAEAFIHDRALCESDRIGSDTRIWAFAHVLPGASIGAECNICDGVFIENDVTVGDRVTVKCGVQLWDGVRLEDDVFVGPNVTFTNDLYPRSRTWLDAHPVTIVRSGASIGANATILPGIEIGSGAMVGAGAVVTRSVPPHAVVVGNPARIHGYSQTETGTAPGVAPRHPVPGDGPLQAGGLVHFQEHSDLRGSLIAGELPADVPFTPARFFLVYDVPSREVRGEHAHRVCHQLLIAVAGSVTVAIDDGSHRESVVLDSPTLGLHIPPMVWGSQYLYEPGSALLVLASHAYDSADYIRDYGEFMREVTGSTSPSA